ncbi:FAD-dependent oxidoreductase domain-containing protein 2-like [Sinocyclocheilus grahami]|uniref:FAD-dependent oxidoreductase domain-containing protein 2-like n=1 Tax=Sinocyclocheilus grahami TaxID=75366 RepID=UPI0007AD4CDF|nr:PREDICTED: FAD-dependent oxidoreductase domain-containing protein 2-like [Sinocyclocheilus grahami]
MILSSTRVHNVLLVSTGLWVSQQVDFLGSDLVEGYESMPTDPEEFKDQAVLILGKGNSAFETAQSILGRASRIHLYSPSPVRLAWQTHYVGDLRTVNNELLDTYQLKSLDGLVEGRLEDIAIVRREKDGGKRRTAKKISQTSTEGKEQLHLTLTELLDDQNGNSISKVTRQNLPGYHTDDFSLRQPYDRVIRYLGFCFNFSIFDGSYCEYLEEFPLQALPQLSALSGRPLSDHGLLVLVMQYGLNQTDTLGPGRAESEWTKAWRSNFLHPVLYYYNTLPTEKDMRQRPVSWPLPRPEAVHHMVEDFLTEWDQPISHSQPLRRFLEHCLQTDLRAFYAESCFLLSLTSRTPPLFCRQGYLRKQGIVGNSHLWQHAREAGLTADHQGDTSVSEYLKHAGAAVVSTMNFDL